VHDQKIFRLPGSQAAPYSSTFLKKTGKYGLEIPSGLASNGAGIAMVIKEAHKDGCSPDKPFLS